MKCPALCESRRRIVNGRGVSQPDVMFIGEAPGNDEDQQGKVWMGASGKLLARIIDDASLDREQIHLTNAVRCRPLNNRTPKPDEIANCKPYLLEEIRQVNPKVIVTAGATALTALVKGAKLKDVAGQTLFVEGLPPIIPTYHPSYYMRGKWGQLPMAVEHVRKARRLAAGKQDAQPLEEAKTGWASCTTVSLVKGLRDFLLSDQVAMIAIDTETTGLDWMNDILLCISFSAVDVHGQAVQYGWTVPIAHKADKDMADSPIVSWWDEESEVIDLLGEIFASDKPKTVQNAIFDIKFIERGDDECLGDDVNGYGWTLNNLQFDPMLAQRIINENLPANETVMLALYTNMPFYEAEIAKYSQGKRRMDLVPDAILWEYASADADGLARITASMLGKMTESQWWLYDHVTIPMVEVAWNMTRRGIDVDVDYFLRLVDRYQTLVVEKRAEVIRCAGKDFNPNSHDELATLIFGELGLPKSGRKTEKAKECWECQKEDSICDDHDALGKDALLDIKAMMDDPHPILDALISYREVTKRRSNWVDGSDGKSGLLRYIRPDAKIHPQFNPGRADTGRWSAVKPAIQTPPKRIVDEVLNTRDQIRRIFIAPDGRVWMELDWSQGEVWVMGYESGDAQLLSLLREGRDVHTFVARKLAHMNISRVFPAKIEKPELEEWEWKKEFDVYRSKAKVFVFGLDYGMTSMGASQRLGCGVDEAQELIDAFLSDVFPSLSAHFERVREQLNMYGQLKTRFGRVGHFGDGDLVKSFGRKGQTEWEAKFRKAVNMPIQSGLSDLHQVVLNDFETDEIISARFPMILAVHDSATGLPKGRPDSEAVAQTAWMIKERAEDIAKNLVMPDGKKLGWEIPVEVQWGTSWGDFPYTLMADGNLKTPEGS